MPDVETQQVAFLGTVREKPNANEEETPVALALRLKIRNNRITEIEQIAIRPDSVKSSAEDFPPAGRKGNQSQMPPVHPGEILLEDFLKPMGISQYRLAKSMGVPQRRIGEIIAGKRSITADTALRLARVFGTDAESWMNLQTHYDLAVAEAKLSGRLEKEVTTYAEIGRDFSQLAE